jgi:hypothetical protein
VEVIFPAPVQTGSGANPVFCSTVTETFQGVGQQGSDFDHSHPFSAEVKGKVELYIYSPSGPSSPVQDILYHVQPILSGTGVAIFIITVP